MNQRNFFASQVGLITACTITCLLWGSAFPFLKIGYGLFGLSGSDIPSLILFAGMRFTLSGLLIVGGLCVAQKKLVIPAYSDLKPISVLATFQTILQYLFFYIGLSYSSGVTGSVIEASNSFLCVLFAALIFHRERLTWPKIAGCIIGFMGVMLITLKGSGDSFGFSLMGEGMIFLSTVASSLSSNFAKGFSRDHDPVMLSAWQFLLGGCAMVIIGLLLGGRVIPVPGANLWAAGGVLFYLGFLSAGAYTLWSQTLKAHPVSKVAVFGFMNPAFGVVLSAFILNELSALDPLRTIGALLLVTIGIVVANKVPSKKDEPSVVRESSSS